MSIEQLRAAADANPVHPDPQGALANGLFAAGDYAAAQEAALRAAQLGYGEFGEMVLLAARCAMRLGDREDTVALLMQAIDLRLRDIEALRNDPDFVPLHKDPLVAYSFGIPEKKIRNRVQGWEHDLGFFDQEFRRRAMNPFAVSSELLYIENTEWLEDNLANLSDAEIILAFSRLLVPLMDGHAYICPAEDRTDLLAALPLGFYRFVEGVFITHASPAYAHLVGKQVAEIEGQPIGEVAQTIAETVPADNVQWQSEIVPFRLRETATLHALGMTTHPDRLTMTLLESDGSESSHLVQADNEFPTAPLGRNFPFPDRWVTALDRLPENPLYLRDLRTPFWYEPLADLDAVYLQINVVRDGDEETFLAFTERFFAMLDETKLARLIIDIRMNKGGNTSLEWPFLHRLIGSPWNQQGRLFVIIGRRTWSAAQNFATYLDLHTQAIFVGEPTGSCPTFNGESVEFRLPWSGTRVNISDLTWQSGWPWDRRPWIPPDLFAPPTWEAYRVGRDVCLEAIAREIGKPTES